MENLLDERQWKENGMKGKGSDLINKTNNAKSPLLQH
jgi:hypothetical protein